METQFPLSNSLVFPEIVEMATVTCGKESHSHFFGQKKIQLPTLLDPAGDFLKINRSGHTNLTTSSFGESCFI